MSTYTERFAAETDVTRTYTTQRLTFTAHRALRNGDTIVKDGRAVGAFDRASSNFGPKWTQLRTSAGTLLLKVASDESVTVERQVETEESQKAMYTAYEIEALARTLDDHLANSPEAYVAKLAEEAAAKTAQAVAYAERHGKDYTPSPVGFNLLDSFRMNELMVVQAEHNFACRVAGRVEAGDDIIRAYAVIIAYAVRRAAADPLSRSTSPVSNIQEDLDRYVAERILDRIGGAGVRNAVAEMRAADRY